MLVWLYFALQRGVLGGDPVEELIHFFGIGALRLLLLTLMVSPFATLLNFGQLNKLRRPLGLWCFAWACLHFAVWLSLDLRFAWLLIGEELIKRTYILVGFTAWLILLALAITSIPKILRAMGKVWKKLHSLIYLAAVLVCVHFWWSVKSGWIEPALYLAIVLVLLWFRRERLLKIIRLK